jgi:hypothetical protein
VTTAAAGQLTGCGIKDTETSRILCGRRCYKTFKLIEIQWWLFCVPWTKKVLNSLVLGLSIASTEYGSKANLSKHSPEGCEERQFQATEDGADGH